MSASLKTQLRAVQYDSLRASEGITGNLTLYKTGANGYELLSTITTGWFAQRERDSFEGVEYMTVRIEMTDENDFLLNVFAVDVTNYVSAVGFMGRVFAVRQRAVPFGDPAEWVFRCDPTGEAI
jgi:hypothetical protein